MSTERNDVLVYTVYQAKGQEADHVFVCGAHAEAFQDKDPSRSDGLRRLYVAITRSLNTLTLSIARDAAGTRLAFVVKDKPVFPAELHESLKEVGVRIEDGD